MSSLRPHSLILPIPILSLFNLPTILSTSFSSFSLHSSFPPSLLFSNALRCLHQSSPPAAASVAAGPSPPARLHRPARGARSRGWSGPRSPHCHRICRRGAPGREWSDHSNSLCAAHPPAKKLHQPTAATAYGDDRS